jgi:putative phosphoesterase
MLVGVISDSHDNLPSLKKAVEIFNSRKTGFVIHAGDFVAPFSLRPLEELACPWIGVFGNNDGEQRGLTQHSKGRIQPPPFELNLDGKKVVVVHELLEADREKIIKEGAVIIIHGHSHQAEIKKSKKALLVNPGELGGWLYGRKTLALVDTDKLQAEIVNVD